MTVHIGCVPHCTSFLFTNIIMASKKCVEITARLEKFIWYKCDREPWRETVTVESGRIAFEGSV